VRLGRLALAMVPAAALLVPAAASAQVMERPSRPLRGLFDSGPPPDPNRTYEQLSITANFMGGYDDQVAVGDLGAGAPPDPRTTVSGSVAQGDLTMRYTRGRLNRVFTVDGYGYGVGYFGNTDGISPGGALHVAATTPWARRNFVRAHQRVSYDPLFTTAASFRPLESTVGADGLPTSTAYGLFERTSVNSDSSVGLDRQVGRRTQLSTQYSFLLHQYDDDLGGDSTTHVGNVALSRQVSRTMSLRGSYEFSHASVSDVAGGPRPITQHTIEAGPVLDRQLSPGERFTIGAGVGALYVDTRSSITAQPVSYWAPYAQARVRAELGRTWAVWGDYRRGTTVLDGITRESFLADTATFSAGGLIAPRLELVTTGAFANGRTPAAADTSTSYKTWTFGTQLRWAASQQFAAVVNYYYYTYDVARAVDLPIGLPPTFDRNAVRVGITVWVPLLGRFVNRPAPSGTN
jgi:hypothetical protein